LSSENINYRNKQNEPQGPEASVKKETDS
jgi:hypothetical protein